MKLFISADIEGCAGVALAKETHKDEAVYKEFAEEMTAEVVAACEAAHAAGADEIVVKDGHGDACNIDPLKMPEYVTLIRGKSGHPYNMMFGLDESFDAVMMLGYHAPAGNPNFAISHTSTGNSLYIRLNQQYMSEFLLNSYTAASMKVPVIFLSGDEEICRIARETNPAITTVATKSGTGEATRCVAAGRVIREIQEGVKAAMQKDPADCSLSLPEHFCYEVTYKDWKKAYKMSFYPKAEAVDTFTNRIQSDCWMDIVTAHNFIVY